MTRAGGAAPTTTTGPAVRRLLGLMTDTLSNGRFL
jgi:hypothetical protein